MWEWFLAKYGLCLGEVTDECILDTPALHFLLRSWLHTLDTTDTQGIGKGYTTFLENCIHLGSCCGSILAHLPKVQHGWPSSRQTFQKLKTLHIWFFWKRQVVERLRREVMKPIMMHDSTYTSSLIWLHTIIPLAFNSVAYSSFSLSAYN